MSTTKIDSLLSQRDLLVQPMGRIKGASGDAAMPTLTPPLVVTGVWWRLAPPSPPMRAVMIMKV